MRTYARLLLAALMITAVVVACMPTQEPAPAPAPTRPVSPKPASTQQGTTAEAVIGMWQTASAGRREVICYGLAAHQPTAWARTELPKSHTYPAATDWAYAALLLQHRCDPA